MPHVLIKYAHVSFALVQARVPGTSVHSFSLASLWKFLSAARDLWYWEVANKHGYCDDQEEHSQNCYLSLKIIYYGKSWLVAMQQISSSFHIWDNNVLNILLHVMFGRPLF